jgi:hypothetical protein
VYVMAAQALHMQMMCAPVGECDDACMHDVFVYADCVRAPVCGVSLDCARLYMQQYILLYYIFNLGVSFLSLHAHDVCTRTCMRVCR